MYLFISTVLLTVNTFSQENNSGEKSSYHRSMKAVYISVAPKLDGRLDDEVWRQAEFSGNFLQREPNEGEPASEKTEIAVIYDGKNLYFGVRCFDSEPDKIIATEMRRDELTYSDDYFSIILDTFRDRRNAFYFTTNPNGLRRDGTVTNEGKIDNSSWDGVWECKTSIDDKGWYIEIAIPWQTLRFKEGDNIIWGANFKRRIHRKNEDDYWRLVPLYAGRDAQYRMSEAGDLQGFNGLKMGGRYEVRPFITGGIQRDESTVYANKTLKDAGLDLKLNLSSTITADITYNTDFAQVEADQEQVNLTRFSLFFPEKREFFREGAETFTFGRTRGMFYRPQAGDIQLFHSRTIGIESRRLVPIIGGARLNGRAGEYTFGMLSMQAEETYIEDDEDGNYLLPTTNFSVFRLKRNLFARSSAGVMILNKQQKDGSYNRSFGFDSNFPVNENLLFYVVGAGTAGPDDEGVDMKKDNIAANFGLEYESDLWDYNASFLDIQNNFNPEMGFIYRTDIRRTEGQISYSPRPERWKSIRQFEFQLKGQYQTDHQNYLLNKKIDNEFSIRFENTARFSLNISHEQEFLDEDWEVRDGFIIPLNLYNNSEYRLSYNTDRTKDLSGRFNLSAGKYFTGDKVSGGIDADFKALNRLKVNLDYSYDLIKLPEGEFHTNRLSTRISYSFSPDLYIKAYFQWYNDKLLLEGRDRLSGNIILRYIYTPGSDFYFVLNQESLIGEGNNVVENRTAMLKFDYFLRK